MLMFLLQKTHGLETIGRVILMFSEEDKLKWR
jgi:hypothetical protein